MIKTLKVKAQAGNIISVFLLTAGSQQKSAINTERALLLLWLGVISDDSVQSFSMLRCEKRKYASEWVEICMKGHVKREDTYVHPDSLGLLKWVKFAIKEV